MKVAVALGTTWPQLNYCYMAARAMDLLVHYCTAHHQRWELLKNATNCLHYYCK